jgi:hypothetical protein
MNMHLKGGKLSKFERCFQQWERLWAWCTKSKRNYFEGDNKAFLLRYAYSCYTALAEKL